MLVFGFSSTAFTQEISSFDIQSTELSGHPLFAKDETARAYQIIGNENKSPRKYSEQELSILQDQLVKLTSDLVSIPSYSTNLDACLAITDYVEKLFKGSGYIIRRFEKNGAQSMIISKKDSFDFDLIFLGHLDVVDNPDLSSYTPKVIGNTLHGRGISDMKAATAGMIKLFLDNSQNPHFENYALVMTTDEQIGGFNGTAHLTQDYGLKAKVVFNPDGGHPLNPSISEKGILQIKLTATGKAAHGSRPWEGKSAIDLLYDDIESVKQQFSYGDIDHQSNITFNLGTLKGGEATNAVPAMAEATIDLRYPPILTVTAIMEKIKNALKNSKLEIMNSADPVSIEADDAALLDLMRALLKQGRFPSLMHETGGCDARWFTPQGSSILLMRLEGTGGLIDDEYVTITGLSNYYMVMENFLDEIADNF